MFVEKKMLKYLKKSSQEMAKTFSSAMGNSNKYKGS